MSRTNCLDASALVSWFVDESGSVVLRKYLDKEANKYTTSICYFEALTVMKVKHFHRKIIDRAAYHKATFDLTAFFRSFSKDLTDLDLTSPPVIDLALSLCDKYDIDLADAFQILSVRDGYFSRLVQNSQTVLVTGDARLSKAAREEKIQVWNFLKDPPP